MPSPLRIDVLELELADYPDREFADYLIDSFKQGFDTLLSEKPTTTVICKNLKSTQKFPEDVDLLVQAELDKGYVIGPFTESPYSVYRINPIGIVEGKYSRKKRLIIDMSAPHNSPEHPSLNSLIDKETCSLSYVKIDDAVDIIKKLGPGAWLCKADMTDAFKMINIHPDLWHLHGLKWKENIYFSTRLVFGSRSSPRLFDYLSKTIVWIAKKYGIQHILALLDDFLTISVLHEDGLRCMSLLTMIFRRLGLPLSPHKTMGPYQCIEYLGIILDTILMEARLPQDKVQRIADIIGSVSNRRKITKRQLLSLLGHLTFAMRIIQPGRSFVSYLLGLAHSVKELHHRIQLTKDCRLELSMWENFLRSWNCVSFFIQDRVQAPDMELYTDAAASLGYGGYYQGRWFYGSWSDDLLQDCKSDEISIAFLELYPIVAASVLWGHEWQRKCVMFHCDNTATVHIINKGRSKSPAIMKLMRRFTLLAAYHNFVFVAKHVAGRFNVYSDLLSRQQIETFKRLAPTADPEPCKCPPHSEMMYP